METFYLQLFGNPARHAAQRSARPKFYRYECYTGRVSISSYGPTPHEAAMRQILRLRWRAARPPFDPDDQLQFQFLYYEGDPPSTEILSEPFTSTSEMKALLQSASTSWLIQPRKFIYPRLRAMSEEQALTEMILAYKHGDLEKWKDFEEKQKTGSKRLKRKL